MLIFLPDLPWSSLFGQWDGVARRFRPLSLQAVDGLLHAARGDAMMDVSKEDCCGNRSNK